MTRPGGIRPATTADESILREMQYLALFVPRGAASLPRSIVDEPNIAPYHSGFGTVLGDDGRIAESVEGDALGGAWVRQVEGYGFVDDTIPELGIAVVAEQRGRGLGSALLESLFATSPRCSLSVDDRNPAVRLYQRYGFELVRRDGEHTLVMLREGER